MTEVLVVAICLLFNMILSGSEMAFVTVNRQQLRRLAGTDRRARLLLKLKENPERTLSVIQIGITVVGAIAAAVGGAGAEEALTPYFMQTFAVGEQTAEAISIAAVVIPISYLSVVIGELVPKTVALRNPLSIALWTSQGLYLGEKILSPAVTVLESSTNLILKLTRISFKSVPHDHHDIALEDLPQQTKQYVVNIVSADKKVAREIMLPWKEVIYVRKDDELEDVETIIMNSRHTRLPVLDGAEVIGLINTKEFLTARRYGNTDWQSLIRPILKFKAFEPLFKILLRMQEQKSHLAVIYERDNCVGLVTMEDIFEEIIGDVFDEDDDGLIKKILASKSRRRPL
ncbi:hemolysin family protein [Bdellovibrio sp. 22V]|uniref:hemolysin family protein n=1 Tax=Bdellovibrio TaxID=958 RepID=UPI0025426ED6|nr:hemolysin family protein [Bdellovibrio sp. 22V]WII71185.1 hemolysin family protein [Bdellovibrio sp. 22V]